MVTSSSDQLRKDHLYAFSCAANLLLYEGDPGPESAVAGGPGEHRTVSRRELLVDIYARMILLHAGGDPGRLSVVTAEARRMERHTSGQDVDAEYLQAEKVAAELAETAVRVIHDAGADTDLRARQRLLAATDYQTTRDVFGQFLGNATLAGSPESMLAELDRIEKDDSGLSTG